mmetsp:Transcript_27568/g.24431  ORF Transcript_27568/g.24431 Transcript_27568/m.24431 type:complete len:133 (-) Transcript_27568:26-424(-)
MEPEIPEESHNAQEMTGGRRNRTQASVLPRSGMASRGDREVEMNDQTTPTYTTPASSAIPSRPSRTHYYEKSQNLHTSKRGTSKRRKKNDEEIIRETMKNKDRLLIYLDKTSWMFQGEAFDSSVDLSLHFKE